MNAGHDPYWAWVYDTTPIIPPCTGDMPIGTTCDSGARLSGEEMAGFFYSLFGEDYVDCANGSVTGCVWERYSAPRSRP